MKTKSFRAERRDSARVSRSRSAAPIISISILAFLLSACGSTATPTVVLDSGNANQPVQVSHSNDGDVVASAIVVPVQEAQLGFSLSGSIKKVHVAAGDQVKAGDLLAELDNVSIQLEVEAAQRTVREL